MEPLGFHRTVAFLRLRFDESQGLWFARLVTAGSFAAFGFAGTQIKASLYAKNCTTKAYLALLYYALWASMLPTFGVQLYVYRVQGVTYRRLCPSIITRGM